MNTANDKEVQKWYRVYRLTNKGKQLVKKLFKNKAEPKEE